MPSCIQGCLFVVFLSDQTSWIIKNFLISYASCSSCLELGPVLQDDTVTVLKGIYDTIKECAVISKLAAGIGVSVHDIHAARIYSLGTDGSSNHTVLVAEFPVTSTVKISKVTAHSYYLHKNIDIYHYPIETARRKNLLHRHIVIGVQSLADAYMLLGLTFNSPEFKS
ncbi:hypothetical protein POM88_037201 [Heracleum sosnowskyi]|uniref:Ribonucleotide reductase large subunit C-terminal domain-containing protein n=1 Tax=Heracleum sosnowskyi TaxID=360622 RepID=A0AAD8HPR9_9APIA|nr:hypothetical protein POM88_037201 [Heracleum sosnowskyi]